MGLAEQKLGVGGSRDLEAGEGEGEKQMQREGGKDALRSSVSQRGRGCNSTCRVPQFLLPWHWREVGPGLLRALGSSLMLHGGDLKEAGNLPPYEPTGKSCLAEGGLKPKERQESGQCGPEGDLQEGGEREILLELQDATGKVSLDFQPVNFCSCSFSHPNAAFLRGREGKAQLEAVEGPICYPLPLWGRWDSEAEKKGLAGESERA